MQPEFSPYKSLSYITNSLNNPKNVNILLFLREICQNKCLKIRKHIVDLFFHCFFIVFSVLTMDLIFLHQILLNHKCFQN